jgi:hypothetical protein
MVDGEICADFLSDDVLITLAAKSAADGPAMKIHP